jgi:hypothetical protein
MNVDISGFDKFAVTAALYNASLIAPAALAFGTAGPNRLSETEMRALLRPDHTDFTFDYLGGHLMKVDLNGDSFDSWGYDRDNGEGAAQRVIDGLLA